MEDKKKIELKHKEFKVLKSLKADRDYNAGEQISLNNKKQVEFLQNNKYIK
jgi:hypothetical protein